MWSNNLVQLPPGFKLGRPVKIGTSRIRFDVGCAWPLRVSRVAIHVMSCLASAWALFSPDMSFGHARWYTSSEFSSPARSTTMGRGTAKHVAAASMVQRAKMTAVGETQSPHRHTSKRFGLHMETNKSPWQQLGRNDCKCTTSRTKNTLARCLEGEHLKCPCNNTQP